MPLRTQMWGAGRIFVLGVALAATYGVFFLASMGVASRAREVKVPDLAGKSTEQAQALLANSGLDFRMDPVRRPDLKIPIDHVLTQDPLPGAVIRRGRTVRVRVSDGARLPPLPDLLGLGEREARSALDHDQIAVGLVAEIRRGDLTADSIVAQDPPARTPSRTIGLLINRGAQGVTYVMPDLIGTPENRATDLLRARGFRVAVVGYAAYPGLPGGVIIRQSPQAGFQIPPGEAISFEVSR
ncbi:MAG: PASTA domain-containing protein [Acidobacteria bacterium]|nr:PASTA domain-containing protein [Acidobacteriota bacterium]